MVRSDVQDASEQLDSYNPYWDHNNTPVYGL
jgi:hypothetical protein